MAKSLFDLIKCITKDKTPWEQLSEEDKSAWSTFMINRWLSMDVDMLPLVNEIQQYNMRVSPESAYRIYLEFLPKQSVFLKYTKKTKFDKYDADLIEYVKTYFAVSKRQAVEYIEYFMSSDAGLEDLSGIVRGFGVSDKDMKKMFKT